MQSMVFSWLSHLDADMVPCCCYAFSKCSCSVIYLIASSLSLASQVGDFYEAIGIDACILVEYAGLNPFGGLRSDSVPRAGCPVVVIK